MLETEHTIWLRCVVLDSSEDKAQTKLLDACEELPVEIYVERTPTAARARLPTLADFFEDRENGS